MARQVRRRKLRAVPDRVTSGDGSHHGRPRLVPNDALTEQVADVVRRGAFDYVAAGAAGVSKRTFDRWMARAEAADETAWKAIPDADEEQQLIAVMDEADVPYWRFWRACRVARAEARAGAETDVYKERKLEWLKAAGRSRPGEPGWTDHLEVTGPEGAPLGPVAVQVTWENDWREPEAEGDGDEAE